MSLKKEKRAKKLMLVLATSILAIITRKKAVENTVNSKNEEKSEYPGINLA